MSSYGNTIRTDTFVGKDAYVDTLHWKTFDPPLSSSGTPTLAAVLDTGDDANNEDIKNANDIECVKLEASSKIETAKCEATLVEANQIEGSGVNPSITGINNIETQNITVVSQINASTSAITCNSVNATSSITTPSGSITNVNSTHVNTTDIQNPSGLLKVRGFQARSDINMEDDASPPVRHNINNANTINATAVDTTAVNAVQSSIDVMTGNNLTLNGTSTEFTGELNMNVLNANGTSKIDFTGLSGVTQIDTFLEGDKRLVSGQPIRTRASYLDLTDGTNRIPLSEGDYRWGLYYAPNTRITKDFDDNPAQVFNENCYFDWSSTNPEHSSCIFELTFFIEEYGYGDIGLSWFWQKTDLSNGRTEYPNSQLFYVPEESQTAFRSVRKVGQCDASWLLTNLPTDGTSYRFWPGAKTDYDDNGRMIVAMRANGGNPNDENQRGAPVRCNVYPKPSNLRVVN